MPELKLEERTSGGKIRNLSGKEAGVAARQYFNLDALDAEPDAIKIVVPDYVYNISPSFFCGMFGQSYKKLGADKLLMHYQFENAPDFIWSQIKHGLELCSTEFVN